ncbi:MAG: aldo/keto reductase [Anaerolineae bacterium]|nr:aldo/keto reductase [Anaerolineae bacterium]
MHFRTLGRTGLQVSVVGLGCAGLRPSRTDYAVQIVHRALDLGVNYFDNARSYGDAEIKLGLALEGRCDEAIISTKTGGKTRDEAWRDIESSLQRLRTDHLDNLHLHNLSSWEDLEQRLGPGGALEALVEAKEQGLTRHIGCTGHRNDILIEALKRFPFETILMVMNFVAREPLAALIPLCVERSVGVTIMKGLSKGRLPVDLALKWLLAQPVQCVVPGAVSLEEVEESAAVGNADLALTPDEAARLERVRAERDGQCCSVCGLCEPCPVGIGISGILGTDGRLYSYRAHGRDAFRAFPWSRKDVAGTLAGREASVAAIEACTRCGLCEERCPRNLPIIDLLQEALPALRDIVSIYREVLVS